MSERDLAWLIAGEWLTLAGIIAARVLHHHAVRRYDAKLAASR